MVAMGPQVPKLGIELLRGHRKAALNRVVARQKRFDMVEDQDRSKNLMWTGRSRLSRRRPEADQEPARNEQASQRTTHWALDPCGTTSTHVCPGFNATCRHRLSEKRSGAN